MAAKKPPRTYGTKKSSHNDAISRFLNTSRENGPAFIDPADELADQLARTDLKEPSTKLTPMKQKATRRTQVKEDAAGATAAREASLNYTPNKQKATRQAHVDVSADDLAAHFGRTTLEEKPTKSVDLANEAADELAEQFSRVDLKSKDEQPSRAAKKAAADAQIRVAEENTEKLRIKGLIRKFPELKQLIKDCLKDGLALAEVSWKDALPADSTVVKIAEASYAEVYRITNSHGSSIFKLMQMKISIDEESLQSDCTSIPDHFIPELRIMNLLADMPGYVRFKAAHLISGKPPKAFVDAWHEFILEHEESLFTDPQTLNSGVSLFLAIELGDAGMVLENMLLSHIEYVWDILLGIIKALADAEVHFQFEHRDLHENNICVAFTGEELIPIDPYSSLRFGLSGIEITILDYGLSRATVENGDTVFNDLEKDLVVFHSTAREAIPAMQFDSYRRMRNYLLTGRKTKTDKKWHVAQDPPEPTKPESSKAVKGQEKGSGRQEWSESMPYTNVLWIRYMLAYLSDRFEGEDDEGWEEQKSFFEGEVAELKARLEPRCKNGFESARDVAEYCFRRGWFDDGEGSVDEGEETGESDDTGDSLES